jgi:Family of unknown function (DUF6069)
MTSVKGLLVTSGLATVFGIVNGLIVYFVANAFDDPLMITANPSGDEFMKMTPALVIAAVILAGIGAAVVGLIARATKRPVMVFLIITIAFFAFVLIAPLTGTEDTSTMAWLIAMHVLVAIPIIGGIARYLAGRGTVSF